MLPARMRFLPAPVLHRARSVSLWGLLLVAMSPMPALAGPPFITDDPEPVDFRTWEINYGLTYLHAAGASAGSLPSLDINYGVYPGVQLHLQPQAAYARGGDARAYGVGDTEVGVKYRLTKKTDDKRAWMLAIYPMLEIPTGSAGRGLGAGAYSAYLPLWAQTTRGNWTVFGGGGYRRDARVEAKNSWAGGMTALYQVSERLQFGAEVFGATRNTEAGRASTGVNFGGVYGLGGGLSLLFSAGHGLRDAPASNQGAVYLGLRSAY
jgi:hypothetical protein